MKSWVLLIEGKASSSIEKRWNKSLESTADPEGFRELLETVADYYS